MISNEVSNEVNKLSKSSHFEMMKSAATECENFLEWFHEIGAEYSRRWLNKKQIAMISNEINKLPKSSHFEMMKSAATECEDFLEWSHEMNAEYSRWWLNRKQIAMFSNEISNDINKCSESSHFENVNHATTNVKIF